MDKRFRTLVQSLDPSFKRLVAMAPCKITALPTRMPRQGVYLFSERGKHLYVGRSDRLRDRLQEHGRASSSHNSAPFAFRLAKRGMRVPEPTYLQNGSRRSLEAQPAFRERFMKAKARVRKMDVRFVEETDPLKQTLLEVYVAVALHTPHNDFANH